MIRIYSFALPKFSQLYLGSIYWHVTVWDGELKRNRDMKLKELRGGRSVFEPIIPRRRNVVFAKVRIIQYQHKMIRREPLNLANIQLLRWHAPARLQRSESLSPRWRSMNGVLPPWKIQISTPSLATKGPRCKRPWWVRTKVLLRQ